MLLHAKRLFGDFSDSNRAYNLSLNLLRLGVLSNAFFVRFELKFYWFFQYIVAQREKGLDTI